MKQKNTMNRDNRIHIADIVPDNYSDREAVTPSGLDAEIRKIIKTELPSVNDNPWFTARVMNRLPEQSRWAKISIWQWICYLAGAAALVGFACICGQWFIRTELSLATILTITSISFLAIVCAGVMMTPALIRILREP